MILSLTILFWLSVGLLFYTYIGYPILALLLSKLLPGKPILKGVFEPKVTVLIAAHNEQRVIRETIENKLQQQYPPEKLQTIVVSDASSDKTDEIVEEFRDRGVILLKQKSRQGKTAALNVGIQKAQGDIIVFSDANSIYESDTIAALVSNFRDGAVGYVTGRMIYLDRKGTAIGLGNRLFIAYENALRTAETRLGSVVGVDGAVDAMRRELFEPLRPDLLPDFVLPLKVIQKGYRVVYDPDAVVKEQALSRGSEEYSMRTRVALRALRAMLFMKALLNPFRHPLFSWQLFSHKLLRYIATPSVFLAYPCSLALWPRGFIFQASSVLGSVFCLFAAIGWATSSRNKKAPLFSLPYYACLVGMACANAIVKLAVGDRRQVWSPRK